MRSVPLDNITKSPGVYCFYDGDEAIYIGESKNLLKRVESHFFNIFPDKLIEVQRAGKSNGFYERMLEAYLRGKLSCKRLSTIQQEEPILIKRYAELGHPLYNRKSNPNPPPLITEVLSEEEVVQLNDLLPDDIMIALRKEEDCLAQDEEFLAQAARFLDWINKQQSKQA